MRGARGGFLNARRVPGIIPADAGSTSKRTHYRGSREDHPRGCGEHVTVEDHTYINDGSSPRMRGAQLVGVYHFVTGGIIPADAGSTRKGHQALRRGEDHPRGCGEHVLSSY